MMSEMWESNTITIGKQLELAKEPIKYILSIAEKYGDITGISKGDILSSTRKTHLVELRALIAKYMHTVLKYSVADIAKYLNKNRATVYYYIYEYTPRDSHLFNYLLNIAFYEKGVHWN